MTRVEQLTAAEASASAQAEMLRELQAVREAARGLGGLGIDLHHGGARVQGVLDETRRQLAARTVLRDTLSSADSGNG